MALRPGGRYELDLGEGVPTIALGPDWTAPRCFETRARRQQLRYLKYERALVEGERVRACTACHSWTRFVSDCHSWTRFVSDGHSWTRFVSDGHRWPPMATDGL